MRWTSSDAALPWTALSHLKFFFFASCLNGVAISDRFGQNFCRQPTVPSRRWADALSSSLFIASFLPVCSLSPSLEMMCPRKVSSRSLPSLCRVSLLSSGIAEENISDFHHCLLMQFHLSRPLSKRLNHCGLRQLLESLSSLPQFRTYRNSKWKSSLTKLAKLSLKCCQCRAYLIQGNMPKHFSPPSMWMK